MRRGVRRVASREVDDEAAVLEPAVAVSDPGAEGRVTDVADGAESRRFEGTLLRMVTGGSAWAISSSRRLHRRTGETFQYGRGGARHFDIRVVPGAGFRDRPVDEFRLRAEFLPLGLG